jgi:hypothetical protein
MGKSLPIKVRSEQRMQMLSNEIFDTHRGDGNRFIARDQEIKFVLAPKSTIPCDPA